MTANNDGDDVVWQIVRDYLNGYITWLCLRHYIVTHTAKRAQVLYPFKVSQF
jgi:hypothetical protein